VATSIVEPAAKNNFHFDFIFTARGRCDIYFSPLASGREIKTYKIFMTEKFKPTFGRILTVLVLAGFAAGVVWADSEKIPFTKQTGGSGSGCPGAYTGYAKMTNSTGLFWITPPTNTSSGTFTDASGLGTNYISVAYVTRKSDGLTWCGTNSVTFPATNTDQYLLTVYVKNTPPPTNGQPMNLLVTWH
jgi:hypothetical protein